MTSPTRFILSALDRFARVSWFTGRSGADLFVSTNIAEAFIFTTREEAVRKADSMNEFSPVHGQTFSVEEVVTGSRRPHLMTDQELRTARSDLIRAKLEAEKMDLGPWVAHRQADVIAEQMIRDDLGVKLSVQGDSFVMEGPSGRHELAVAATGDRRLSEHWDGFKRENQKRADTRAALAQKLKAYAAEHYEDGFDSFVECYEDKELEEFVGDLATWDEVLDMAKSIVSVWEDRRADGQSYLDGEI